MVGMLILTYWSVLQEWLGRATNWAKFSATAGLGVIHRGHLQQGRALMAPYLPQNGAGGSGSQYSEGGALYALGLIHANHGEGIKEFLRESLRNTTSEVLFQGHIPKFLVGNNPFMSDYSIHLDVVYVLEYNIAAIL
jgi:26S proteasome regulatory subunit N2